MDLSYFFSILYIINNDTMVKLFEQLLNALNILISRSLTMWGNEVGQGDEIVYFGATPDPKNPSGTPDNIKYLYSVTWKDVPVGDPPRKVYRQEFTYNADDCIILKRTTGA